LGSPLEGRRSLDYDGRLVRLQGIKRTLIQLLTVNNRPVRPLGPTDQTGLGAMVAFPSSPEPIVTIPPVQAASGRSGGNTSVAQGIPFMVPFETGIGYGYAPNPQVNSPFATPHFWLIHTAECGAIECFHYANANHHTGSHR
jgi:hypothetical protein